MGGLMGGATLDQSALEDEGLLVAQALAGRAPLLGVLRRVDPAPGGQGANEVVGLADLRRQGLRDVLLGELVKHRAHSLGHPPRRQGLGGGVNRHRSRQQLGALGLVQLVQDLEARAGQLAVTAAYTDLA